MAGLLFSPEGRIGRGRFWLGCLVVLIVGLMVGLAVAIAGIGAGPLGFRLGLLAGLPFLYPVGVLALKRLRDRGRRAAGAWTGAYLAPGAVTTVAQAAGLGFRHERFGDLWLTTPTAFGTVLIGVAVFTFLLALVDLGMLPGRPPA